MSDSSHSQLQASADKLSNDLKLRDCPAFVGALGRQTKGGKLLCINDGEIPLDAGLFGDKTQVSVGLIVVDCLMEGYTKVPYECVSGDKYKVGKNPLPLSEVAQWPDDPTGTLRMLKCWPYGILNCPKDKDDRNEEYKWEVYPGKQIRASFWRDSSRGGDVRKFRASLCPAGYDKIPAFSLLEVEIMCKGWSRWEPGDVDPDNKNKPREICPVKKGYGMGISGINVYDNVSPYSVLEKLGRVLPGTLDEVKTRQQMWQSKFPSIKDLLQTDKVAFFVHRVSTETSVDMDERPEMAAEPPQIRLSRWSCTSNGQKQGSEAAHLIDILQEHALAATNCPDLQSACALLELAANAGALSLLVCANPYRQGRDQLKSMLYAYPLINTHELLRSIPAPLDANLAKLDDTENYWSFKTDFQMSLPAALPGKPVRSRESKEDECDEENENNGEEDEDDEGGIEEMMSPLLLVSRDPFTNVLGEHALKTPDFMMVGNNVQLPQRAYYVRFVHPILQHQCILWSGYINLSKPQITMPGLGYNILAGAAAAAAVSSAGGFGVGGGRKRSRWGQTNQPSVDPFAGSGGVVKSSGGEKEAKGGGDKVGKQQLQPAHGSEGKKSSSKKGRS